MLTYELELQIFACHLYRDTISLTHTLHRADGLCVQNCADPQPPLDVAHLCFIKRNMSGKIGPEQKQVFFKLRAFWHLLYLLSSVYASIHLVQPLISPWGSRSRCNYNRMKRHVRLCRIHAAMAWGKVPLILWPHEIHLVRPTTQVKNAYKKWN